jgi:hypothetical protein
VKRLAARAKRSADPQSTPVRVEARAHRALRLGLDTLQRDCLLTTRRRAFGPQPRP